MAFGFTSCPEVCPTTLATLAAARKQLGSSAKDVQVLYLTVDPARDDAKRMHAYLGAFDPSFVGGTGSEAQLAAVRRAYGATSKNWMELSRSLAQRSAQESSNRMMGCPLASYSSMRPRSRATDCRPAARRRHRPRRRAPSASGRSA